MTPQELLRGLFDAGVTAVLGNKSVANALTNLQGPAPDQIIAIGKAATAMAQAAHAQYPKTPVLIVTKYDHSENAPAIAEVIEAAHPVLDENALVAGARLLDIVQNMPGGSHLMMLVSGGASALAEAPIEGLDLAGLQERAQHMLGSGADIHEMNAMRKTLSRIKGGKLLEKFSGARVTTLAISDVEGDALSVIGSGIGNAPDDRSFTFEPRIVASNALARDAIAKAAEMQKIDVQTNLETLYEDIATLGPRLAQTLLSAQTGLHIRGGEPTVVLPANPGQGGRNQALALILAREFAGRDDTVVLVAGTDGTDGPTDAAGAIIDGDTWDDTAADALTTANAGAWLEARSALIKTGPTGTNVMDLVIALKS